MAKLTVTNKSHNDKAFKVRGGFYVVASGAKNVEIEKARELTEERIESLDAEGVKVTQSAEDEAGAPAPDAAEIVKVPAQGANTQQVGGAAPVYAIKETSSGWYGIFDAEGAQMGNNMRKADADAFEALTADEKAQYLTK
jgi:hypothetical protein